MSFYVIKKYKDTIYNNKEPLPKLEHHPQTQYHVMVYCLKGLSVSLWRYKFTIFTIALKWHKQTKKGLCQIFIFKLVTGAG